MRYGTKIYFPKILPEIKTDTHKPICPVFFILFGILFFQALFFLHARSGECDEILPLAQQAVTGYDDLGRKVVLPKVPERIVVLSGTPLDAIFEMGAGDKIVGVVDNIERSYPGICRKYPVLPTITRVGRYNAPNMEKIIEADPDLIIPYASVKSPGTYTAIFEKQGLPYAGFTTVTDLAFGLDQIKRIGILLGKEKEAEHLAGSIKSEIDDLAQKISARTRTRPVVYYWWGERNATYGRLASVHELIELAGGTNLTGDFNQRYMEISPEYVISRDPEVIVISFWQENQKDARIREICGRPGFDKVKAVKNNRVFTLDGHILHTPLRFAEAIRSMAGFIHPELSAEELAGSNTLHDIHSKEIP